MRELKFRAWDTGAKRWASGVMPVLTGLSLELKPAHSGIIIEQYTGLKDKNGKEIYEGDIVRYFDDEEQITEAVIKQKDGDMENGYWITGIVYEPLRIVSEEDLAEEEYENLCGFEVIGNIHDNPELLERRDRYALDW